MRVLVVSNYSIFRDGLVRDLGSERSFDARGAAFDCDEADFEPDVVLCVVSSSHELLEYVPDVVDKYSPHGVLCLMLFDDDEAAAAALRHTLSGIQGIMDYTIGMNELVEGLRSVANGEFVVARNLAGRLIRAQAGQTPHDGPGESLTARETEVLHLLADGQTNREIAQTLGVSEHTVRAHLRVITQKLGVSNRVQAAATVWKSEARRGSARLA
jgi:DNA-binding NarL/FixJ family response regulator